MTSYSFFWPLQGGSPSKVCPKCEPHLAAMAGTTSAGQGIPREPAFSRRKKLPGHDKQVTFTTDYTECGSSTAEVKAYLSCPDSLPCGSPIQFPLPDCSTWKGMWFGLLFQFL